MRSPGSAPTMVRGRVTRARLGDMTMQQAAQILENLSLAAFALLGAIGLREWRRHRGPAAAWAAGAFGVLALVAVAGRFLLEDGDPESPWERKVVVVALVLFPYLLYRFMGSFGRPSPLIARVAGALTLAAVAGALILSRIPAEGEMRSAAASVYAVVVLAQWTFLFTVVTVRLWRGARQHSVLARRRMRLLALASTGMNVAIVLLTLSPADEGSALNVALQALGILAAALFGLGLAPPRLLRLAWRGPAQAALRSAVQDLMSARSREEVAARMLPHAAGVVGARAAALVDGAGRAVGSYSVDGDAHAMGAADAEPLRLPLRSGALLVWIGPYAPYFGQDELELLRSLGVLVDLALDRCDAAEREREFVANAAHELRTPLTTVFGVATTLAEYHDTLGGREAQELLGALRRQSERARFLINNLLDLAQIDRGALLMRRESVPLAAAVRRALEAAPPPDGVRVDVLIDEAATVLGDAGRVEQVIVNLLTNSYRYGGPTIQVEAARRGATTALVVADDGPGIPPELASVLFEPFRRGPDAQGRGSGLGLAICRRLVEAMGGEIAYEANSPSGARFTVRLGRAA